MKLIDFLKNTKHRIRLSLRKHKILSEELKNYNNEKSFWERDILVLAHSLEKGMGIPNTKKGYGKEKGTKLVAKLDQYMTKYNEFSFAYNEGITVLDRYIELMKSQNEKIDNIIQLRNSIKNSQENNYCSSGFSFMSFEDLNVCDFSTFRKYIMSRHSIRHYSKEKISVEELKKAVSLANEAPSACNRQPVRVYYTTTQEKAAQFEKLIDGSHGFQGEVPYYMVITSNRAYFSEDEYLQWYTNAGIYLAFLTLSLHACGIGSIILQWKYSQDNEPDVKRFFGISGTEAITAVLGFGKYPKDGTKCITAQRMSAEDTLTGI